MPAPKCPKCGRPLEVIVERKRKVYKFRPESNDYVIADGEHEVYCGNCGADVVDTFYKIKIRR